MTTSENMESNQETSIDESLAVSKYSLRKEIWTTFDKNGLVTFPRPVRGRIPNFQGASDAAEKLRATEAFQKASIVKVNADKPQETVRVHVLEAKGKRLVVSPRRDSSNPLLEIELPSPPMGNEPSPAVLRAAATQKGMLTFCNPLTVDDAIKIDLLVVGSVAVSRLGQRIGKCDGYTDLEFSYLKELGIITEDTIIATTVHDCQVFDTLPDEIFRDFDFPVDIIVTPTEVITVAERKQRPSGIIWKQLSNRRMALSPAIQVLHKQRVESGQEECYLKDEDTDEETEREIRRKHRPFFHRFNRRILRGKSRKTDLNESDKVPKPVRRARVSTGNADKTDTDGEMKKETRRRPMRSRPWQRHRILFTIKIGGISSTDRVRDLKNALAARNVKPAEIAWFGRRGFAFVHFAKPKGEIKEEQGPNELDTVVASLQDMKLGEEVEGQEKAAVIVEAAVPAKRPEEKKVKTEETPVKIPESIMPAPEKILVQVIESSAATVA